MFTGIIEGLGTLSGIRSAAQGRRLSVQADFSLSQTQLGESIAVNGVCLTVTHLDGNRLEADVSPETLRRSTLASAKQGERVNLERALRLSDRLGGHLVSGHIDGTGTVRSRRRVGNAIVIAIALPTALTKYLVPKGSVAVDGISLTVNTCQHDHFEVSIIPHSAQLTTIGFRNVGDAVNIETDIIGKYVERLLQFRTQEQATSPSASSALDKQLLARAGFL